ncbi:AraC family transcriptional regulator [Gloeocapsopsis sp. IPPAS B-1203]|uniref:helix-turn-helix transcriptional regulator n=1 Tax=Gloeocapsopsis sp. IPPAS B-1203 TaxID=2049454 RepID=UPI000C17E0BF|nr:AraC family transcriptional regulator [Gloeocapsopsis sp. IPPAS B-1203]PIG91059.1 AraC family transcriptional regulator [Gloeocapsopsis sp. IPPAS B-1203]
MPSENPLVLDREDKVLQIFPRPPILTSFQAGWDGIMLGYMCQPAYEVPEMYSPRWHSIAIFTHGNYAIHADRKLDGRFHRDAVFGGDIVIAPANVSTQASWDAEGDFILLALEKDVFARAIDENYEEAAILPHFATPDPLIFQIGLALKTVLASDRGSRLYAETMANALSVHLLQHYSAQKPVLREYAGGLTKRKLQQVVDYINDYLDRDLGLAELAAVVQMSPHYFCHLFKQSTGLTPHQYVIRCRVERAKMLLHNGEAIADTAYTVGFANQSHLNRHFKRIVGVTPKQLLQK